MNHMIVEDENKPRPDSDPAPVSALVETEESLAAKVSALQEEKAALYDQLLRKQADFDNFRKRTDREKREYFFTATMDVIHSLLPVIDGLERAVRAPAPSVAAKGASLDVAEEGESSRELRKGVQLIHKQFQETLTKLGLTPIETGGKKFDPHLHHAVEMVETEEHEDQS